MPKNNDPEYQKTILPPDFCLPGSGGSNKPNSQKRPRCRRRSWVLTIAMFLLRPVLNLLLLTAVMLVVVGVVAWWFSPLNAEIANFIFDLDGTLDVDRWEEWAKQLPEKFSSLSSDQKPPSSPLESLPKDIMANVIDNANTPPILVAPLPQN